MNPDDRFNVFHFASLLLSVCSLIAGLALTLLRLSGLREELIGGQSGFLGGFILIGSGLISLSLLSRR